LLWRRPRGIIWIARCFCTPRVCVVNPCYVHDFRRAMGYENKTDITDAEVLARFGEVRHSNEWRPLSVHTAKLRDLVRRREDLLRMVKQERNRLSVPGLSRGVRESLERMLEFLGKQLEEIEGLIREVVESDDDLRRQKDLLETIDGVGFWTAVVVLVLVGNIGLFRDKRALASYFGVNPQNFESGKSVRIFREYKERLVSRGNRRRPHCALLCKNWRG